MNVVSRFLSQSRGAVGFWPRLLFQGFSAKYPWLFTVVRHRCVRILWPRVVSCLRKAWSVVDYLLLPRVVLKLFFRHLLALVSGWALFVTWRLVLYKMFHRLERLLVNRIGGNRVWRQQRSAIQQRMRAAQSFVEWKEAAEELDHLEGRDAWKNSPESPDYDYRRIECDWQTLRKHVRSKDIPALLRFFAHSPPLLRNAFGINDHCLYSVMRIGTKQLIENYRKEVIHALRLICTEEVPGLSHYEKLAFFSEMRHAFGRTAFLLSGGATLGLYHAGVVKALLENGLLPTVISGSSVGSVIVAILGTRTDKELRECLGSSSEEIINLNFFPPSPSSWWDNIRKIVRQGFLMDISTLEACLRSNVPDMTFLEAYHHSGRIINIVVSPSAHAGNLDSSPRLLNYLTAPNVLVWSAALASCAIPGIYSPVELLAKDPITGTVQPYFQGQVKWEDGSMRSDLPMQRLSELFNVNHFVVSQVNPHVLPFILSRPCFSDGKQSSLIVRLIDFISTEIKQSLLNLHELGVLPLHPTIRFVLDQHYLGNITIVPNARLRDFVVLLRNPTAQRLRQCIEISERATWQYLGLIEGSCQVEFALEECVKRARGAVLLDQSQMYLSSELISRVRSWSTDVFDATRRSIQRQAWSKKARRKAKKNKCSCPEQLKVVPDQSEPRSDYQMSIVCQSRWTQPANHSQLYAESHVSQPQSSLPNSPCTPHLGLRSASTPPLLFPLTSPTSLYCQSRGHTHHYIQGRSRVKDSSSPGHGSEQEADSPSEKPGRMQVCTVVDSAYQQASWTSLSRTMTILNIDSYSPSLPPIPQEGHSDQEGE